MRPDIAKALLGLGEIYEKQISDELIQIWFAVLEELTPEELSKAVKTWVLGNNPFFPKPGQIYRLARPEPDAEGEAALITEAIFSCLGLCGWDDFGIERVKKRVGEIGWALIELQGGWERFNKNLTNDEDLPIYKSQTRKSLMGILERKKAGLPLLPTQSSGLQRIGSAFGAIEAPGAESNSDPE